MKYSTSYIIKRYKTSYSYLHLLRTGRNGKSKKKGKVYEYTMQPYLIEGKDWKFERGEILYSESAIKKLDKKFKKKLSI